ncbi:HNH endonuclease signature motif containing protein [Nocardioides terrisoli]|uniref:HNH endonuclease signature motif containing protein n=1 Tax=Nocardioides terrisoli TaxID=3388267 RepID=UPI00287BC3AD|nr:hypothetical protein [Nocardioides marmorisolisilvae]
MITDLDELPQRQVLLLVEEVRQREMAAQADTLTLACHWCDLHGEVRYDREARAVTDDILPVHLGGPGTPWVEEFAAAEFGAMRRESPMAARSLLADALDLRHRLVHCWAAVHDLELEVWVARKIARMTRHLSRELAAFVDRAIAAELATLSPGRLFGLVAAKVIEADPVAEDARRRDAEQARFVRSTKEEHGLKVLIARAAAGDVIVFEAMVDRIAQILAETGDGDAVDVRRAKAIGALGRPAEALRLLLASAQRAEVPDENVAEDLTGEDPAPLRALLADPQAQARMAPAVRLYLHLTAETVLGDPHRIARVEGLGAVHADQLREWLGQPHQATRINVQPVINLLDQTPVDAYQFPTRIREAVMLLHPADAFPYSTTITRRVDLDHCRPYSRGRPSGQTGLDNVAPLVRHHHRIKTLTSWHEFCLSPGRWLWISPHGFAFLVDRHGTRRIDRSEADALLCEPKRRASASGTRSVA